MERMEEYQRMREEEAGGRPGGAGLPGDQGQGPGGGAAEEEKRTGPGGCMPVSGPGDRHGLGHGRFRRAGPAARGKRGTVDPLLSGVGETVRRRTGWWRSRASPLPATAVPWSTG